MANILHHQKLRSCICAISRYIDYCDRPNQGCFWTWEMLTWGNPLQEAYRRLAQRYKTHFETQVQRDVASFEESRLQDLLSLTAQSPSQSFRSLQDDFQEVWDQRLMHLMERWQQYLQVWSLLFSYRARNRAGRYTVMAKNIGTLAILSGTSLRKLFQLQMFWYSRAYSCCLHCKLDNFTQNSVHFLGVLCGIVSDLTFLLFFCSNANAKNKREYQNICNCNNFLTELQGCQYFWPWL